MTTLVSKKENLTISFQQDFYILESNHGNHTGYNRKWTTWYEGYNSEKEAMQALAKWHNEKYECHKGDENYETEISSDWYDGRFLSVVTPQELIEKYEASGSSLYNIQSWSINIEEITEEEN